MFILYATAIAWKKKRHRKHSDNIDNFIWFHMCLQRLFPAPTMEIAAMLQRSLVVELLQRGEPRASKWYDETWTQAHGNYTHASAG